MLIDGINNAKLADNTNTNNTDAAFNSGFQTILGYAIDGVAENNGNPTANVDLDAIFTKASETYNVNKNLLLAIGYHESRFQPQSTSSKGAMGIMQLMPATAAGVGVTNAYDPEQNIMGAAKILDSLLSRYNDNTTLALAAYAMGPAALANAIGEDLSGALPSSVQTIVNDLLSLAGEGSTLLERAKAENAGSTDSLASSLKDEFSKFSNHASYGRFMKNFQNTVSEQAKENGTPGVDAAALLETPVTPASTEGQKELLNRVNTAIQATIVELKEEKETAEEADS